MLSFAAIVCLATGFAQVNSQWGGWADRGNFQNGRFGNIAEQLKPLQQQLSFDPSVIQKYREDPRVAKLVEQARQSNPDFIPQLPQLNKENIQKYSQMYENLQQQSRFANLGQNRFYERFNQRQEKPRRQQSEESNESNQSVDSNDSIESRAI